MAEFYEEIWAAVESELSGEAAVESLAHLWEAARFADFAHIGATAARLADRMRAAGLEDVRIVEYPADGVTHYGGWVLPQAWDLEGARLEIVDPAVSEPFLASYEESPLAVMIYSAPTPPGGVTAPVVRVDGAANPASWKDVDVRGAIVLMDTAALRAANLAFRHGAIGVLTDEPTPRRVPDDAAVTARFLNYTIPPWKTEKGFGFGLSRERGERLRALLDEHGDGNVRLRAEVRSRLYDGTLPLVTGLLPGETDEEVLLTGHLCEPGANDNTSGIALSVEIARTLKRLRDGGRLPRFKRGLRLCHTYEVRGTNAYVNTTDVRNVVAGINLDMVARDETIHLFEGSPFRSSYATPYLRHLLTRFFPEDFVPSHASGLIDDNVFAEPLIGASFPGVVQFQDWRWHSSEDTMEAIDAEVMRRIGVASATFCATVMVGLEREAERFAEPDPAVNPPRSELGKDVVYRKAVRGYVAAEHLTDAERDALDERLGFGWGWGAPDWLQYALFACDGRRSVSEIAALLETAGIEVEPERLVEGLAWAHRQAFLERRETQ